MKLKKLFARQLANSTKRSTRSAIEQLESRIAPAYVASLTGAAATLVGDGSDDALVITAVNGLLSHNRFAAGDPGFASAFDFDSTVAGVQTLAADPASSVAINTGTGTDSVLLGGDHHAANLKASFTVTNADATGGMLEVNDSAGKTAVNLVVSATSITGSGFQITEAGLPFNTVTLRTGAGADTILVASVSAVNNVIESGAGNDSITGTNGVMTPLRIDGGDGADTIMGGGVGDIIHGGAGNDLIVGGRGNDSLFGDGGVDTFVWNPGDASDVMDGGTGADQLVFNGANINEQITMSSVGGVFHLTRDVANITMDTKSVEHLNLTTLGGADTVIISDLSTTAMKTIRINSAGSNGAPDGLIDTLIVNGSDIDDHMRVDTVGSDVQVSTHGTAIQLSGFDTTDNVIVNGGLGQDNVFATAKASAALNVGLIGDTFSNTHGSTTFATAASFDAGKSPISIASANLFGTGGFVSNDLVVADSKTNAIQILENNGDGTFLPAIQMSTGGTAPRGVVIEDFNHDSHPDIAVTNSGTGNVSVFLNAGDGTFSAPTLFTTGKTPGVLRTDDVTGDGKTDLIMTSAGNTVTILPGNGDGTFGAPIKLATGGVGPTDIAIADFSNDGRLDIAVANGGSDTVTVLDANVDFTFAKAVATHVGVKPTALVAADFDGDGTVDLAVTHGVSHFISLLLNGDPADGKFSTHLKLTHRGTKAPEAISAGDIDGDGHTDLVVGNTAAGTVSVFLNLGSATFAPALNFDLDNTPPRRTEAVVLGDFNGDGLLDIATANAGSGDVSVLTRIGF